MKIPPQKFREIVFQLLYCSDFDASEEEDLNAFLSGEFSLSKSAVALAQERRRHVASMRDQIDLLISEASAEYSLERIPRVERTILRLGVFELLYDPEIPEKVAIAEAIRLARKYAASEGGAFVNAVLDTLYHKSHESRSEIPAEQATL